MATALFQKALKSGSNVIILACEKHKIRGIGVAIMESAKGLRGYSVHFSIAEGKEQKAVLI